MSADLSPKVTQIIRSPKSLVQNLATTVMYHISLVKFGQGKLELLHIKCGILKIASVTDPCPTVTNINRDVHHQWDDVTL